MVRSVGIAGSVGIVGSVGLAGSVGVAEVTVFEAGSADAKLKILGSAGSDSNAARHWLIS
jgi:hypothetical protein